MLAGLVNQFATLDFALLRTLREAAVHPGRLARAYVKGRRRPYTNPVAYAFLTGTVLALAIGFAGFAPWLASPSTTSAADYASFIAEIGPALPYLTLIGLVPTAAVQRWLLRRETDHNVAECYVALLYAWAQMPLFTAVIVLAGAYGTALGSALTSVVGVGYLTWSLIEFESPPFRAALGIGLVGWVCAEFFAVLLGFAWIVTTNVL